MTYSIKIKTKITIAIWIIVSMLQLQKSSSQSTNANSIPVSKQNTIEPKTDSCNRVYPLQVIAVKNYNMHAIKMEKINDTVMSINEKFDKIEERLNKRKK